MRRVITAIGGIAVLWAAGFLLFLANLPTPSKPTMTSVDGIVVYTGGRGMRISAAMGIFADGNARRMLISGVHPDTSLTHLADFWFGTEQKFECCVDLGREALTTRGNAKEATMWVDKNGYDSIVLVTSDYHMPRALAETRARIGEAAIIPYVVQSDFLTPRGRPTSVGATLTIAGEYSKFLLMRVKAFLPASSR